MFTIVKKDTKTNARIGIIQTAHGEIETPFFMPVATKGAIKYLTHHSAEEAGTQCIISNALINSFTPGLDLIEKAGGLHGFIGWDKPITTDSGGFQLLSETFFIRTTDRGAIFRNPFSGKRELITPEDLMRIQQTLGSDIAMILDDVPHHDRTHRQVFESMKKTHEWARRCKKSHARKDQLLFGIAQGGIYKDLREHSIKYISALGFDGIALGGLAIGEPTSSMYDIIEHSASFLPKDRPHYLMGVGSPEDMVRAIALGIDMFDSTYPTSNARHSTLFTSSGKIKIRNKRYREDKSPIDSDCSCMVCKRYSRSFIHHLMRYHEPLGKILCTHHNITYMHDMLKKVKSAIQEGRYDSFVKSFSL